MKTEELIAALAADAAPRASATRRMIVALPAALGVALAAFLAFWGLRPGLGAALDSPVVLKTLAPLGLAALAAALALALARPEAAPRLRAAFLALALACLVAAFGLALAEGGGAQGLVTALMRPELVVCLVSIPTLAVPILVAALWALAAGAPLGPARTGAIAGLAAGAGAAALYSLNCDQDAPLFVLPAYGAAILLVAALGAALGARFLRW